jgi:hypothetical protein
LRSYNRGYYTSNDFKYFCEKEGIMRELTVSYKPWENGVTKRKNRYIISSTKAMIHDQEFPMFLWVEACNASVYVHNMGPHMILGDKTLKEAFSRVKPEI